MGDYRDPYTHRYTEGEPPSWVPVLAVVLVIGFLACLFFWVK